MSKEKVFPSDEKMALYDKLIATNPNIGRKGKTTPYTSANGYMFSYLAKSGVVAIRLPEEEREAFLRKYGATLDEQHGSVMKEFVRVPDELLQNTEELSVYLDLSLEYVKTLKPKPTKRKKRKD